MDIDELLILDIKARTNEIYKGCQELVRAYMPEKWYKSELEFSIIEKEEINGRSWSGGNVDYVELNVGVIALYYKYFINVMEHDKINIFQKIIPGLQEREYKELSYEAIVFKDEKINIFDSKVVDERIARMLEIFVSRFIVLHELGHLFNGHCKRCQEITQDRSYFMPMYYNPQKEITNREALDIRTLEMDADAFAATQSVTHIVYLYDNFCEKVNVPNIEPKDIFYWWGFAIRSHFLMCQEKFKDSKYYENMTHMPSNARWTMIYNSVTQVIGFLNKNESEKNVFVDNITKGAVEAEFKFNRIMHTNYRWFDEIINNEQYIEYKEKIDANWEKMKFEMEKFARLPLYTDNI